MAWHTPCASPSGHHVQIPRDDAAANRGTSRRRTAGWLVGFRTHERFLVGTPVARSASSAVQQHAAEPFCPASPSNFSTRATGEVRHGGYQYITRNVNALTALAAPRQSTRFRISLVCATWKGACRAPIMRNDRAVAEGLAPGARRPVARHHADRSPVLTGGGDSTPPAARGSAVTAPRTGRARRSGSRCCSSRWAAAARVQGGADRRRGRAASRRSRPASTPRQRQAECEQAEKGRTLRP